MLVLIFSTWVMKALRYDGLERHNFQPLGKDRDGDCIIRLVFSGMSGSVEAIIVGCGLYMLYSAVNSHRVHWVWERPAAEVATGQLEPVVSSITINHIGLLADTASQEDT